jgi:hypothetical protein
VRFHEKFNGTVKYTKGEKPMGSQRNEERKGEKGKGSIKKGK